ncbi:MAG: DNA polymerase III subunit beta [bacterium]
MRFVCNRKELEKRIQWISKIIPTRSTKESLSSILIKTEPPDKLYLYGTNIEIGIETLMKCETDQEESFLIPAKLFRDIIDSLGSNSIVGDLEDRTLNITADMTIYHIPTQNMTDFPIMDDIIPEEELSIDINTLRDAVKKVMPFVDKTALRPVLSGIFIDSREDETRFVSTDANRLAVKKIPIGGLSKSVILPSLSLETIVDTQLEGDVILEFSNSRVRLRSNDLKLTTSTIEGVFPVYEKVIPKEFVTVLRLDKDSLRDSIRRVLPISREEDYAVKFSIKRDKTIVSARSPIGVVFDELVIPCEGDELDITFSANYILDFLSVGDGQITISLSGELSSALFTFDSDPHFIYVTMPMEAE